MTDIPGDSTTTAKIAVGDTITGTIDTGGDHDWYAITLTAGQKVTITLDSYGASPLADPYLYVRDTAGTVLQENDDGDGNRNSRIVFTADHTGTYYIDAAAWDDTAHTYQYTGGYQLSVQPYTPPPVFTYDQIADQLVNGYWGGDWHHFDVTQGGTITVNLTGLTADGQTLARAALAEWTDVIGVNFKEVTTGGQIVFDDSDTGAYTTSDWTNHIITSSHVNISTQWLTDYGTSLNSYAFQSYVHEIGHALGLGHAGNYNNTANYPDDALYSNDAWSTSVMSYFSQHDNSYFGNQGFTEDYALTPMGADIVAMQTLYGLSTTTRTGNTIYGYGSNAGNPVFNATVNPHAAYTIIDSGGTDTLNFANTTAGQLINLNPETFSNVAGDTGNLSIAIGTIIENANGGSGDDTIIGNAANNVLNGGGNQDTVSYETATAGVTVNLGITAAQNTQGAGIDTLSNFETLVGSQYADVLTGAGLGSVYGGSGDDVIHGASGGDHLYGQAGNDTFIGGTGYDVMDGGDGWDTVDYSGASKAVTLDLSLSGPNDAQTYNIEQAIGTAFDDSLTGTSGANILDGMAGNDALHGGGGDDTLDGGAGADSMDGGSGNDTFVVDNAGDIVTEASGGGTDIVDASISYTLGANVEKLVLTGTAALSGTGNADSNVLTGNSGDNMLSGGAGDDSLYGNAGNDRLDGGTGVDKLYGGTGDDTYIVSTATAYAYENAGEGTDTVYASVTHTLRANIENLTLTGSLSITGKGNDQANVITGNSGSNHLYGLGGDDRLIGNEGNDTLDGGTGVNRLYGGTGNDTYYVNSSTDYVYENAGEGTDRVYSSVSLTLRANVENLTLTGSAAIDGYGNELANIVTGNVAANVLKGGDGNDKLYGGAGNDVVSGDGGNDWIEGGAGQDRLYGGTGSDSFVFRDGDFGGATTATADHIYDFSQTEHDHVRLSLVDADTTLAGDQAFHFLGTAAFDGTAGALHYAEISGNTYVSGDTNGDGTADFMIRIDGLHTLTSSDFVL